MSANSDAESGSPAEWQAAVDDFNARYGACLDAGRLEDWPAFFTDEATYTIISRESHEMGLPMGVMSCSGRGMFTDRVVATRDTLVFGPRYLRHIMGRALVSTAQGGGIAAETPYLVLQTAVEKSTEILQCGRYSDRLVVEEGKLKLASRACIYDSTLIPNALIFPI